MELSGFLEGLPNWLFGQSAAFITAVVILGTWVYLERRERRASQKASQLRNDELSDACLQLVKQHSDERASIHEKHAFAFDSFTRNVLEALDKTRSRP